MFPRVFFNALDLLVLGNSISENRFWGGGEEEFSSVE